MRWFFYSSHFTNLINHDLFWNKSELFMISIFFNIWSLCKEKISKPHYIVSLNIFKYLRSYFFENINVAIFPTTGSSGSSSLLLFTILIITKTAYKPYNIFKKNGIHTGIKLYIVTNNIYPTTITITCAVWILIFL